MSLINQETINLVCFNSTNEFIDNAEDFKRRLHQINDDVIFHTELESCLTFIQSLKNENVFLILSGSSASQILPYIPTLHQIACIFIFCLRKDQHEHLLNENSKIIGIYDKLDFLCSSIQQHIHFANKRLHVWNCFDLEEYANKDLSRQSNEFFWFQLFHEVILHLPRDEQAKKQMIDACRYYYRDNMKELERINEFEHEYKEQEALKWYLKSSFLSKMINKALQTENIDQLYKLRYFLGDLIRSLSREHQQILPSDREKLIVYRTLKLSNDEFQKLRQNKGKLISMKGFLTANTDRSSALSLSLREETNLVSVLFEIECDVKELGDSVIFADITQFIESPHQERILFDLNVTFRMEAIQQDAQMWIIKVTAVNDGRTIIQKYIDDMRCQIENLSLSIIFGKLICDMSQWDQSQIYLEQLLIEPHDEDIAWIEHSIGQVYQWKGEWNEARKYLDRSYERMTHAESTRTKDSALVLSDIGEILHLQGKYEEAYEFHQQALTIRKNYYAADHVHIAISLVNIGLIHFRKRKYEEALVFLQQGLAIQEKHYKSFHVDIATSLINIGWIFTKQKKFDEALNYCQRAMLIYKNYYSAGHVYIADTLNSISEIFCLQEKYDEALDMTRQALSIQKKYYSTDHIDIVTSFIIIADINGRQEKYDESLHLYQQALTMQMKYYSAGHLNLFYTLNNIGYIQQYGKENYDEALHFYQQALTMLETYYPSYHAHIALTLSYIGSTLNKQRKTDEALQSYHRALKMQKDYYLSDHVDIVLVLTKIGNVLKNQGKYDEALDFYQQGLLINEKLHPSSRMNIVDSLMDIGHVKFSQRKFDDALDYYQRAVTILKEFHPTNHIQIVRNLQCIAWVWYHKQSYDRVIEYLKQCLKIREASLSPEHISIADTLSRLGHVHQNRHQYDLSLFYELRCFLIREKVLLPDHRDIGKSLFNIGKCYEQLNRRMLALEYYRRALIIYEQCLPSEHQDRSYLTTIIEQISGEIEAVNI